MDIGVTMPTHGLLTRDEGNFYLQRIDPGDVRPFEFGRHAERCGYHSLWFSDHVVMGRDLDMYYPAQLSGRKAYPQRPTMFDAAVIMGGLAEVTSRIKLAPSVHIAPYRHPLSTAHQFACIDYLSRGRLIMGVGVGWEEQEFMALGADFKRRGSITEECVRVYRAAWTQEWIDFDGRFFQIHDVSLDPKPWQKPCPPIVMGATTEKGAARVGRVADGLYTLHLDPHPPIDTWRAIRDACLREGERVGRDMTRFWYGTFASALPCDSGDPIRAGEERPTLTGTPEEILEDIQRFADEGYQHITCHFHVRSGTAQELFEIAQRFAEEVLPSAREIKPAALA
jgi:probable F420-dependent oxidoreductase